jgi:ribulose-bisphosphate carboxylase large chain
MAAELTVEQTIEFPLELVASPWIREQIVGQQRALRPLPSGDGFVLDVEYADELVGGELGQLLNVLFGNSSLKPGIRVEAVDSFRAAGVKGPRFGLEGLRKRLGAQDRPLLCSALKPMGSSVKELATMAFEMAMGGVDLIKDDHGLANQPFCPFEDRVRACAEAVQEANLRSGGQTVYCPNPCGSAQTQERAHFAKAAGAGGLLLAPGLIGFDAMRALAEDDALGMVILMHPALLGSFVSSPQSGLSHALLFGTLARAAGADVSIFPSYGGRFSFSPEQCRGIRDASLEPWELPPLWPAPAGGMSMGRVAELIDFYGRDVVLLIGGDLHRDPQGLRAACARFRERVEQAAELH